MEDLRRTRPSESTGQMTYELRDWSSNHGATRYVPVPLRIYYSFHLVLLWYSWMHEQVSLLFLCLSLGFFYFSSGLSSPIFIWFFLFDSILFWCVLFYLLESCSFLETERKGADLDGKSGLEELGGIEVFCMRKWSVFNKEGK